MCLFCAAVPMAASLGAAATAKQKQAKREQPTSREKPKKTTSIRAEYVTGVVIVGLLAGSALYHSQISPI